MARDARSDRSFVPLTPVISLPKGGGAIRGMGEKLTVHAASGSASCAIPIPVSPSRGGFHPDLALSYESSAGNGPFGLGWRLNVPAITRKTELGLPRYQDEDASDVFVLAGAEDLVPKLGAGLEPEVVIDGADRIYRYRPRVEHDFARIERVRTASGDTYWRTLSPGNVTTIYGRSAHARIANPADSRQVYAWLVEESYDDTGNAIRYEYKSETLDGVDPSHAFELTRISAGGAQAQRYLKRVRYGNASPRRSDGTYAIERWHFEIVFDYGEHVGDEPSYAANVPWPVRADPVSWFRAGFEVRTYRLCRRILMFHHFDALGAAPCLVRAVNLEHVEHATATFLVATTRTGYGEVGTKPMSLPATAFGYSVAAPRDEVSVADEASLEGLPQGLDDHAYRFVDLDGEGLPGIITEQGDGWFYKRSLGKAQFAPPELLAVRPTLPLAHAQFIDLDGTGQQAVVALGGTPSGSFERTRDGGWAPFVAFASEPRGAWSDRNLRLIDLDGDGRPDALITEDEVLRWHPSLGRDGFGAAHLVRQETDEAKGPRIVFADGTESIHLADMSGDGLTDLVRIRNGEVCYWPNLGFGRFGAKIVMDGAPTFDAPDLFRHDRIRLGDIDGSGTTDILYLGHGAVRFWINQSGNRFDAGTSLSTFPEVDSLASVAVLDLLGSGTACLVWSSPLPGEARRQLRYLDLMGGVKPHLLTRIENNLGAVTQIHYAPSTQYYLRDRAAGIAWATRLPFVTHVVARVETHDEISGSQHVTTYAYRHGHYDGREHEFRGFAFVEQHDSDLIPGAPVAPVMSRSWFHVGAYFEDRSLIERIGAEFYAGDRPATPGPPVVPAGLTTGELVDAYRALRGQLLRQEVYALDGNPAPYVVRVARPAVRLVQPSHTGQHAVFDTYVAEDVTYHYERDASDPRVAHHLTLQIDAFGVVTREAELVYPRRAPAIPEQAQGAIGIVESDVVHRDESRWLRLGVPIESRRYELTGLALGAGTLVTIETLNAAVATAAALRFHEPAGTGIAKRLLEHARYQYLADDLSGPLPIGTVESRALHYRAYQLLFTTSELTAAFGTLVDKKLLGEGQFVPSSFFGESDDAWWSRTGDARFDATRFFLPTAFVDVFGHESRVTYDAASMFVVESRDALDNVSGASIDYRFLAPTLMTDPNGNRAAAQFNALGLVVATAVMGKPGSGEGDTLDKPTQRIEYDLFAWQTRKQPPSVHTLAREIHGTDATPWQESYAYCDGFGRELQRKLEAEPGPGETTKRWLGTGRVVYDNKGNPVKQFDPFFSTTSAYESDAELAETGLATVSHYDPVGRVVEVEHPNGTLSRTVIGAWREESWDENDTVFESRWYAERLALPVTDPEHRAAVLAAKHAKTPKVTQLDALGRAVRIAVDDGTSVAETRYVLDFEGNALAVIDPLGRTAQSAVVGSGRAVFKTTSIDCGARWGLMDVAGRTLRSWDGEHTVSYRYDALGRTTHQFVETGGTRILSQRHVFGEAHPDAAAKNLRCALYCTFDAAGSLTHTYDFKGKVTSTTRRLARRYTDAVDWSPLAELTDLSALALAADAALEPELLTTAMSHDALGRPIRSVQPDGSETRVTFNEANLLARLEVKLPSATTFQAFIAHIDYDERGRRSHVDYGNGVRTQFRYEPTTRRLSAIDTTRTDGKLLQALRYTYDAVGNIVQIDDAAQQTVFFDNDAAIPRALYEYDALYRLALAEGREHKGQNAAQRDHDDPIALTPPDARDGSALIRYRETYRYDPNGNIAALHHENAGTSWTRVYRDEPGRNRLAFTSREGDPPAGPYSAVYAHDARGNMTKLPHLAALTWDFKDQLQRVDLGGGGTAYYVYDAKGQRIRKVIERLGSLTEERIYVGRYELYRRKRSGLERERSTLHIMDGEHRFAMIETLTVDDARPVATASPVTRYQLDNHLGSACLQLDFAGDVISYEEYHPFGTSAYRAARSATEATQSRFRYSGKERDDETGLYYYGARYYAPWLGRWISADPARHGDGATPYAFVLNNPIKLIDPDGREEKGYFDVLTDVALGGYDFVKEKVNEKIAAVKEQPLRLSPIYAMGEGNIALVKKVGTMGVAVATGMAEPIDAVAHVLGMDTVAKQIVQGHKAMEAGDVRAGTKLWLGAAEGTVDAYMLLDGAFKAATAGVKGITESAPKAAPIEKPPVAVEKPAPVTKPPVEKPPVAKAPVEKAPVAKPVAETPVATEAKPAAEPKKSPTSKTAPKPEPTPKASKKAKAKKASPDNPAFDDAAHGNAYSYTGDQQLYVVESASGEVLKYGTTWHEDVRLRYTDAEFALFGEGATIRKIATGNARFIRFTEIALIKRYEWLHKPAVGPAPLPPFNKTYH
jgi:RHS repeat-associated protein